MSSGANNSFWLKRLRPLFWLLALVLGGLHTSAAIDRHSMNPDGIAYLDIADAYARFDWGAAINTYWSPLYSWILGLAMLIFGPSMQWEFATVHMVNFLIYLVALICFEFFWLGLMRYKAPGNGDARLPEWAWISLGYSLFIYSALNLIKVWSVTPDMLVAALIFLAAGLVVRIRARAATWRTWGLQGLVLGAGYLAKAAMFPLAFVVLGISFFSSENRRHAFGFTALAVAVFFLVAGPFIAVLSTATGRLTFGDAGKLMYAWYANDVPHPHWQGESPRAGTPKHTSRKIFESPGIYEFARPIGGTYPVSYDPSYWYDGVAPYFDLRGQLKVLLSSVHFYFDLFFRQQGGLVVGVLVLYFLGKAETLTLANILRASGLAVLAVAAFTMYALVHVQSRYIGAFVVLLWADLWARIQLPDSRESQRLLAAMSAVMLAVIMINIAAFNFAGFRAFTRLQPVPTVAGPPQAPPPTRPGKIAEELHRVGIQSGDKIAVIGYAFDSFWARLARVKIVAEMSDEEADAFWSGKPSFQSEVLRAFASTGARAIVAERVPAHVAPSSWHRLGLSNYYAYLLAP